MRPSLLLLNAAKKTSGTKVPVELTPLFLAMSVALASGCYFTYRKLSTDDSLRITSNPEQSALEDVLRQAEKKAH
ncbi:Mra1p KNAG_0D02310 [Huiozyma naganishii CBS 8797]|uniref:Uncharacterized protein n=1 Tax=Huiozyma naganishii (strain ATCC MYA-139 / BCRC 22969 / CBS 8797 / KCTC 17520 / NBRC 10181 / NCYC 3082 / Yp74L-3) TaxID=1071383 RepID=J7S6Y0_HUIN7|nr:hypothetical protein KNAG_0D02310 [Kazachstania naganishii CBS 8797]CCK69981.1 hypothetical protein KNAG_0D02310 [Kazachstania naganishii CBS 8797]